MVFGQSQIYLNILADMRLMRHGSKKNWGSTLGTDLHISFFSLNILFDWRFNLSTNNNINLYERFDEISPSNGSWLISYILNRPPSMLKITSVHARKKQKISISRLFFHSRSWLTGALTCERIWTSSKFLNDSMTFH